MSGRKLLLLNRLKGSGHGPPVLDGISLSLIIFNIMIVGYFATIGANIDPEIAITSLFMGFLTVSGLIIHLILFGKPKMQTFITMEEAASIGITSIFGVFIVGIVQILGKSLYPFAGYQPVLGLFSTKLILMNIAIGEETFLRFGIQPALAQQFQRIRLPAMYREFAVILVILLTNVVFGLYHYVYYKSPDILFAVFISGIVLSAQLAMTNRFSVPLLTHIAVNLM